jgi:hypothetical protein
VAVVSVLITQAWCEGAYDESRDPSPLCRM